MIKTFKETITGIQDSNYGSVIIAKTLKEALWYWTKYLILISVFPLLFGVFALTRYLPEAPKFIREKFPVGTYSVKDHRVSTTATEPFVAGNKAFSLIINLSGDSKLLDTVDSGILVLSDRLIAKYQDGKTESQDFSKIPDYSVNRDAVAKWVSQNLFKLWLGGFALIIVLGVVSLVFAWVFRLSLYAIAALGFWALARLLLKKQINYAQSLNIALYASIPQVILSLFLSIAPSQILEIFGLVTFLFLGYTWIKNLPGNVVPTVVPASPSLPEAKPTAKPAAKPRSRRK